MRTPGRDASRRARTASREREYRRKERADVHPSRSKELERRLEPAAARPDDRHLVHDERRRVEAGGRVVGRLPDDRARAASRARARAASPRASPWPRRRGRTRPARARDVRPRSATSAPAVAEDGRREAPELAGPEDGGARPGRDARPGRGSRRPPRAARRRRPLRRRRSPAPRRRFASGRVSHSACAPGVAADAEDRALRAVPSEAFRAPRTAAAREVDLADDALPEERRGRGSLDDADELVAGDAREAVVAALQLEVGVADPREEDADEGEAPPRRGPPHVADGGPAGVEDERAHSANATRDPASSHFSGTFSTMSRASLLFSGCRSPRFWFFPSSAVRW